MYIMRGLPGSGKSTLAKSLGVPVCSADDFFMAGDKYNFVPKLIGLAHAHCKVKAEALCALGEDLCIDNTNIKHWEYKNYLDMAKEFSYEVEILVPTTDWAFDPDVCFQKNTHGVPLDTIKRMKDNWEE